MTTTSITLRVSYDGPLPDPQATAEMFARYVGTLIDDGKIPKADHDSNGEIHACAIRLEAWPTRE